MTTPVTPTLPGDPVGLPEASNPTSGPPPVVPEDIKQQAQAATGGPDKPAARRTPGLSSMSYNDAVRELRRGFAAESTRVAPKRVGATRSFGGPADRENGILDSDVDDNIAESVAKGAARIATSPVKTAKAVSRGVVNTLDDTAETIISLAARPFTTADRATEIAENSTQFIDNANDFVFGPQSEDGAFSFVQDVAQFSTGFFLAGKFKVFGTALKNLNPIVGGAARGAIVDFAAFDPQREQLAEVAASTGVPGLSAIGELLSVDDDDGVVESRIKRAAAGVVPGVVLDGLVASAKFLRGVNKLKDTNLAPEVREAIAKDVAEQGQLLDDISEGRHVPDEPIQVVKTDEGFVLTNRDAPNTPTSSDVSTLPKAVFPTRAKAEAAASSGNAALSVRAAAKQVDITPEQSKAIFDLAAEVRTAGDDPKKLLDAFDKVRFNFTYLDVPEKTENLLRAISKELNPVFEEAQLRPSVSFQETIDRAMELSGSISRDEAKDYLATVGNVFKNADANLAMMRAQLNESAEAVHKWAQILDTRLTDPVTEREARLALKSYTEFAATVQGASSGAGRGLRSLAIPVSDIPKLPTKESVAEAAAKEASDKSASKASAKGAVDDETISARISDDDITIGKDASSSSVKSGGSKPELPPEEAAVRKSGLTPEMIDELSVDELRDVMQLFRLSKDHRVILNTMESIVIRPEGGIVSKTGRSVLEFFVNGLLSAPATWEAIFSANVATNVLEDGIRAMAGVVTRDPALVRSAADLMRGRIIFAKQSVIGMKAALEAGHSIIDPKPVFQAIPDNIGGQVVRIPTARIIPAIDEFTRVNSNLAFVFMRASKVAREDAARLGLKGKELSDFVATRARQVVETSRDPVTGASRIPEAREFAALPTFSSPLRPGSFGADLEDFVRNHPIISPLLLFMRTAINVFDYTFLKSSPLGLFTKNARETFARGGEDAAILGTRMAIGSSIWGASFLAAFGGKITGNGPTNPKLRSIWLKDNQPYSVTLADGSQVSYRRFEPFATSMSVAADLAQIVRDNANDPETVAEATHIYMGIIAATASAITNKTYLTGLIDFSEAINGGDERSYTKFAGKMLSGLVPGIVQTADTDPLLRDTRGLFGKLIDKLPGWGNNLPVRYDIFGDPILLNPTRQQRAFNPFPVKPAPETFELANGEAETIENRIVSLGRSIEPPPTTERFGERVVNLHDRAYKSNRKGADPDQTPYDRWMELLSSSGIRERLEKKIASKQFGELGTGTETLAGGRQAEEILDDIRDETDKAKRRMLNEFPALKLDLKALRRSKSGSARSDRKGNSILENLDKNRRRFFPDRKDAEQQ